MNNFLEKKYDHWVLWDHGTGFDQNLRNQCLEGLSGPVYTEYVIDDRIQRNYPDIKFCYSYNSKKGILNPLVDYHIHPELTFQNFVCSFNGSPHVSRKFLVSALQKFKFYNPEFCSKNFAYAPDELNGHISDFVGDDFRFYAKFFEQSEEFSTCINSFGYDRFNHSSNIYNLERKLTQSFLQIVSETSATSYYPFVTEKFLYSVVTRGLFLAYAQPEWHDHLEKHYGFKKYTKIFDYRFDAIQNPIERLVELMSMISKFSILSTDDWRDLYLLEYDTIAYNYDHYFSQDYLKNLTQYE